MATTYYFEKDPSGQPITPLLILTTKNGLKQGVLNIDESTLVIKVQLEDGIILLSEMSCDMHKYIDTKINPLWNKVKNFKLITIPINIPHIKARSLCYEIEVELDEADDTVKHITGTLVQVAELSNINNYEIEIRTEADINRDDYVDTVFYNPSKPEASIINRILHDKAGHYEIYHVDNSLKQVKRTFSFNGDSVYDCLKAVAEEVDCIIIFGESTGTDLNIHRTISFYDGKDYCPSCKKRGDFSNGCTNPECTHTQQIIPRYGKDTTLFVNKENLGESINVTVNTDNIKNCYRLTAGDDDMTAAVILCNPAGSRYIWKFSDDQKEDMSTNLKSKINAYESAFNNYKYSYNMPSVTSSNISTYNSLVSKYQSYSDKTLETIASPIKGYDNLTLAYYNATYMYDFLNTVMMPLSPDVEDTTASLELAKYKLTQVGVRTLTSMNKTTATNEVEESIKLYVDDALYNITFSSVAYSKNKWTGKVTLTSYTDKTDTASKNLSLTLTEASADYLKGQVEKYIKKKKASVKGIKQLMEMSLTNFQNELKKYCLSYLSEVRSVINAVLSILDDAGVTQTSDPDVYNTIYSPYSQKLNKVTVEIATRQTEVKSIKSLITEIEKQQKTINNALNLQTYLGTSLWNELITFRREEEQSDGNFISTGLTNAQLIQNAKDFYDQIEQNIEKLNETQYSVSCTLKDLMLLLSDEYSDRVPEFDVGNWLRIQADEKIYKLQLISYEIDFSDLTNIQVEFSDAKRSNNTFKTLIKNTKNTKNSLTDVSKKVTRNATASNIVYNITNYKQVASSMPMQAVADGIIEEVSEDEANSIVFRAYNAPMASVALNASNIVMDTGEILEDYLDKITKERANSLAIVLTNEFEGISTDEFGEGGDFSDCHTAVQLYYGSHEVTDYESVEWTITIPDNAEATWDGDTHIITVNNITGDSAIITIKALYLGVELTKEFTIKKIKSGTSPIIVEIESSAGNIFKNRGINTVLTCIVKQGNTDISHRVTNYHWVKYDQNGDLDPDWSRLNTKTITLSPADVFSKGIFTCEVSID